MEIDLRQVPFSRRGSYFAVSRLENRPGVADGLYLRTVHGDARTREIFAIDLLDERGPAPFEERAQPQKLDLVAGSGLVEVCIPGSKQLLIRGRGVRMSLRGLLKSNYDLLVEAGPGHWQYACHGSNINLMITAVEGTVQVEAEWTGVKDESLELAIAPSATSGQFLLSIEEFGTGFSAPSEPTDFDRAVSAIRADFDEWEHRTLPVSTDYEDDRRLAAYVNWCSLVEPRGLVRRQSMYMSKNWMSNVWSWDHCFNAMALTQDPPAAVDQFMTMFDHQDELGGLPDFFSDAGISSNFAKPPIHGWALQWMLARAEFDESFVAKAYDCVSAWTNWWFDYRDYDRDGFPQYNHGNDSGWDNSTAFRRFVPVESPDLMAFLVMQMDALAQLAARMGRAAEGAAWAERSEAYLARFLREFWVDGQFVARHATTHEEVTCDSLIMYIPLVLGDSLPTEIFDTLADGLDANGFLTDWGLATESTRSAFYESDGYWRGPIWAPSTMIIVDGLARGGRQQLAGEIARRFCSMVALGGMAENFDALTGQGLRDRAYTWTASVFLILANEYATL